MAVTAKSYFSNAIVGVPQVAAGQVDIYKEDTTPRFAIGTKFERQDGAVFRYAHFGATIDSAGLVCHVDVSESATTKKQLLFVASSSTYQMPEETSGVYPNMLGSRFMIITLASVQTDTYAGGYITITSGPASSRETYRIKGNTATNDPDSGNFRLELYEKLKTGVGALDAFEISPSRWANLEASLPATGSDLPAGVSMIAITTAGDYGWVQTKGICGVLAGESTIVANRAVVMSTETAGAVDKYVVHAAGDTTDLVRDLAPVLGFSVSNGSANHHVPILLNID